MLRYIFIWLLVGSTMALLRQIQRLMHASIFARVTLHGVGPWVAEPAAGLTARLCFAAPDEEMRLRKL
jgi:hypothetical protein